MKTKIHDKYKQTEYVTLKDDGQFPNNERLPLILYRNAVNNADQDSASIIENLFSKNHWVGSWRNGIYNIHHYHSTAHEVLGVYSGSASVQLGGEQGIICELHIGDVVVIPAGVAHKRLKSSADFRVVGAYPTGQTWDMCYGKKGERPKTDQNITDVPTPQTDPVLGDEGPLLDLWRR